MAELNFKQITDKLNEEFSSDGRKLVFWYDSNADFADDIESLNLENAKVLRLEKNNQFYVKHFLERVDTENSYLIYAPFSEPDIRENHLADTIRYSKTFFADRTSLLCVDLGIKDRYKGTIQRHISFFNNKDRIAAFYGLGLDEYTDVSIEDALMSVLCKLKTVSFEEIVRCILSSDRFEENPYLSEFAKYELVNVFWKHCDSVFGYNDSEPTLEKLAMTLFVTYAQKTLKCDIPSSWEQYVSYKPGNVVAFLDNLMNSMLYAQEFERLSDRMYQTLGAEKVLSKMSAEDVQDCSLFRKIDEKIIGWMIDRLVHEDTEAKLDGFTIPEVCCERRKKHFGKEYKNDYHVIENAYELVQPGLYSPMEEIDQIAKNYIAKDYQVDRSYRSFYFYYDQLVNNENFEELRQLVENIYTNEYLNKVTVAWSKGFAEGNGHTRLVKQLDFFDKYIRTKKEKVAVIISDALRYEVAQSLCDKLLLDAKCEAKISAMQGVIPSITSFGMAALLPHKQVIISNDHKVLVDGLPCVDTKQRAAILASAKPNSKCVQFDEVRLMNKAELRDVFTGQDVVYIYHNQIDARGDKAATENEVFNACEEAVKEIYELIKKVSMNANTYHFIITADHGFIYKRDKLKESDKISGIENSGKRFAISDAAVEKDGIVNVPMDTYMEDPNEFRYVITPMGADVFKTAGSGLNYVHGGCSPQEMIIPVIEVRAEKSRVDTKTATIDLVSLNTKITNLNVNLDFIQSEPVSDTVKETAYKIYFEDENGNRISNENIYHADNREAEATKRVFKLKFSFKNQAYDRQKKYYLVIVDERTGMEIFRKEIIMDLAFAGDFGFGF